MTAPNQTHDIKDVLGQRSENPGPRAKFDPQRISSGRHGGVNKRINEFFQNCQCSSTPHIDVLNSWFHITVSLRFVHWHIFSFCSGIIKQCWNVHYVFPCLKVVASLTISFHLLALGTTSLLIPELDFTVAYTGMFPVGDTSCRTLIAVCLCVCVSVCLLCVRRHIAKLRQEWLTDSPEILWVCWVSICHECIKCWLRTN